MESSSCPSVRQKMGKRSGSRKRREKGKNGRRDGRRNRIIGKGTPRRWQKQRSMKERGPSVDRRAEVRGCGYSGPLCLPPEEQPRAQNGQNEAAQHKPCIAREAKKGGPDMRRRTQSHPGGPRQMTPARDKTWPKKPSSGRTSYTDKAIRWVPGHRGAAGNGIADAYAKRAATNKAPARRLRNALV